MIIENRKEFMAEEEIRREDDSVVTVYKPEKCYFGSKLQSLLVPKETPVDLPLEPKRSLPVY